MTEEMVGLIGGSGLGDVLAERFGKFEAVKVATPFGKPSGAVMVGKFGNRKAAFINRHGDGHKLSPSDVPYAANIYALKKIGARAIISTCAVGSLKEEIAPKELVIVDQFIDKTFRRQSSFFGGIAAVHCEMAEPVCKRLGDKLAAAAKGIDVKTHKRGTYVCMEGPQFSTRAESLMHRGWGGELIGMTAMPEAKLAKEAQMCYALVAMASDYDCWREQKTNMDKQTLLKEIIGNLQKATENTIKLIEAFMQSEGAICSGDCVCRKSLELAVWTPKEKISDEDKKKLSVLFE